MAYDKDITDPTKFNFNGPVVRRMSAEQIWDSLLVLTVANTDVRRASNDPRFQSSFSNDPYEMFEKLNQMDIEQIKKAIVELADKTKRKKKNRFKNSPEAKKLATQRSKINKQIQAAKRKKNAQLERKLRIDLAKLTADFRKKAYGGAFSRASEMDSPAQPGHFLREFGQSDREQIENSNSDPAVTQVLSMMNGYVEEKISRDASSVLMQTALAAKSAKECTESVYLSMLNRKPLKSEARAWNKEFDAASKVRDMTKVKEVYADLIWTLANSNEFIFVK
jgi:hypothetical protein